MKVFVEPVGDLLASVGKGYLEANPSISALVAPSEGLADLPEPSTLKRSFWLRPSDLRSHQPLRRRPLKPEFLERLAFVTLYSMAQVESIEGLCIRGRF